MARVGTKAAREVLAGVLEDFGVTLADLQSMSRSENVCLAKQEFLDRCGELKIQIVTMAETLGVTRGTIHRRSNPVAREKHRLHARHIRAKAKASSTTPFNVNHFAVGSIFPRGVYIQFLVGEGR